MKSMPNGISELDPNLLWVIGNYLNLIEEFACSPEAFGTGGPAGVEAMDRIRLAVVRRDEKAEERAILDGMRVEVREFWQEFPELHLLGENFRQAALRKDVRGSRGRTDPDSLKEGLRLARALLAHVPGRALLAHIPGAYRLSLEWESAAVSSALADQWLYPIEARTRRALQKYIKLSKSSRVYFDAVMRIWNELNSRGEAIPSSLSKWFQGVKNGRRRRPRGRPIPASRPVTLTKFLSDLNIQITVEILRRVEILPEGNIVSGCHIVSMVLAISEDQTLHLSAETVTGIWQERIWKRPFEPVMAKYSEALHERYGPFPTHTRS